MINELIKECVTNHSENPSNQILTRTSPPNETPVQFKSSHYDPSIFIDDSSVKVSVSRADLAVTKEYVLTISNDLDEAIIKYFNVANQPSLQLFSFCHELAHLGAFVIDSLDAFSIVSSEEPLDEAIYQIILQRYESFMEQALDGILRLTALLKKLTAVAIRLQHIANAIHNRISRNPTPYKKEPPIGGVKVGGKQHHNHRHVARTLYLRQPLSTMT